MSDEVAPDAIACDVCVVGTGPAGSTVAAALADSGLRVVVLESGVAARHPDSDELDAIESVGWARHADQWLARNRILGGSSHTWWGRTRPFDPIDLAARPWVPYSGWPVTPAELAPWLERAAQGLGVPAERFPEDLDDEERGRREVDAVSWRYSRDPDRPREPLRFGPRIAGRLGPAGRLLTGRTVVALRTGADDRSVREVEFADAAGTRGTVRAQAVVLAAGGIENARLLLAAGLGGDLVGRFLMDHPRGTVARFDPAHLGRLLDRFGWARTGTALRMRGLALTEAVQRREQLLNAAAWPEAVPAPDDPIVTARRLLAGASDRRATDVATLLRAAPRLAAAALRSARGRAPDLHRYSAVTLEATCEQVPDPTSRVTLGARRDRHGVPIARVDWHVSEAEAHALHRVTHLVGEELLRLGLPAPVPEPWVTAEEMPPADWTDIAHPTGTTRMAARAAAGVVDEHCAVHGVGGLFVAGSSVFPTAGHANPTLMIVALALRLGAHLRATVAPAEEARTSTTLRARA